ncbi:MAG: hypothetical protein ACR2PH_03185, partial [Desulfobulbia bacterium]
MEIQIILKRFIFAFALMFVYVLLTAEGPVLADDTGLAGSLHALKKERGRICMVDHFHTGVGADKKSKYKARKAAIKSWEEFTGWEYGSDWAKFSRARNRGQLCKKTGKTSWSCSVEARPCRRKN